MHNLCSLLMTKNILILFKSMFLTLLQKIREHKIQTEQTKIHQSVHGDTKIEERKKSYG